METQKLSSKPEEDYLTDILKLQIRLPFMTNTDYTAKMISPIFSDYEEDKVENQGQY